MDLQLPGIDGTEALRQLRDDARHRLVPVVAVTAFAMTEDRERALRRLRRLPEKPISVRALPAQVRELLAAEGRRERLTPTSCWSSTTSRRTCGCSTRCSPRAATGSSTAALGRGGAGAAAEERPDLVLLDILMPGMDGYEVCRRIRADPATAFLPVVMITASGEQEKLRAIEAGADDFVTKPFDQSRAARPGRGHWSGSSATTTPSARRRPSSQSGTASSRQRVQAQVAELERVGRLRRFLSPQVAELVVDSGDESFLESHRREIVVVFCDLRGFTPFAETSEPEEVMAVLREYHAALGDLVHRFEGTLERFTGDGLMVFFNDPMPCEDAAERAIRMAVAMRGRVQRPRRRLDAARPRPRLRRSASPRASPPWAGSGSRAGTTTPRSAASPTWPPGCARRPSRGRSSSPSGCMAPARGRAWSASRSASSTLRGFSRPVRCLRRQGARRGPE